MNVSNKYISSVLHKLIEIDMNAKFGSGKNEIMLPVSEVITVLDLRHPNTPKTIEAIKYIINQRMDHLNGFDVDFNSSYTKFRKTIHNLK